MEQAIIAFPLILQQKNFIFLSLLESEINIVSKRIKHHIVCNPKGKLKVHMDIIELLITYKAPYLTVEVFFSIFMAIGAQTKSANKKLPKAEKANAPEGSPPEKISIIMKNSEEPIKIKKTTRGTL